MPVQPVIQLSYCGCSCTTRHNLVREIHDTTSARRKGPFYGSGGGAPTRFDVVNTSNLADRTGILNLMCLAGTLLKNKPSSTLHTEIVSQDPQDERERFKSLLGGDTTALSLLLGLTPVAYW